jgi:hypothetical protein
MDRALCGLQALPPALRGLLSQLGKLEEEAVALERAADQISRAPQQYEGAVDPALVRERAVEVAELKAVLGRRTYDLIDEHICALDMELGRVEAQLRERFKGVPPGPVTAEYARERRAREGMWELRVAAETDSAAGSRRGSVVSGGGGSEAEFAFDPNEPTYCVCSRPSFGEMIQCDNEECAVEWFHFECVGLANLPKGQWFCPTCKPKKQHK